MGSFGERLRREREMRGITIEEIAEATKIGSRNLRALEEEKFDLLPGGIFNKGFVRAYSKYLGLDEEQAVADYIAAETAFHEADSDGPDQPVVVAPRRSFAAPIVVVLVVVVALGGFFGWRYYQNRLAQREAERVAEAAEKAAQNAPAPAPAPPSPTIAAAPTDGSSDPSQAPGTTSSTTSLPTSSTTPAANPDTTAATPLVDGFVVLLKAKQDSWVSAKADGKSVFSALLKAQNEKTLRARDRMEVMLGNAGGIQVSYNGKDLNLANTSGQVKTLVFTAQGLQPDKPE